mmetsp:Transcript_75795/g.148790  ORF Transcript_75795/g.148790 Transcript_75795/m.148790 type:complete len:99 (+) Transcript_75795:52-348(+)
MDRLRAAELADKKLLDEIEASTGRTYQHTTRIHDEISTQNWKANQMEAQFVNTKGSLRKETESIAEVRHMGDGMCWMYGVIALQVVGTIFLLYVGLSR